MKRTEIIRRFAPALGGAALLASAGLANATITAHRWVWVDNSEFTIGANAGTPSGLGDNVFTFDLFLEDDGVDVLTAIDSNESTLNPNEGLRITGGTFHQVDLFGSENDLPPSAGELDFRPELEFDSYLALGPLTEGQILTPAGVDFGVAGGTRLSAVWGPNPGGGGGATIPTDENGEVFVGRFSIVLDENTDPSEAFFGGELLGALASGTPQVVTISNAFDSIPAPGSVALFGLAGFTAARRRR